MSSMDFDHLEFALAANGMLAPSLASHHNCAIILLGRHSF
jgi:hypothetical protein